MEDLFVVLTILVIFCVLSFKVCTYRRNMIKENLYFGSEEPKYIPKKIFQVLPNKKSINPKLQKNIDYIKSINPGWEHILYDDNDMPVYIATHYGDEMLKYYLAINPKYGAARADFFRYLLMYREGGVYLDIKSGLEYPLEKILRPDDEYILSHFLIKPHNTIINNKNGEYQQWHIICKPKHPYLEAVIREVIKNIKNYTELSDVGRFGTLKTTGPIGYTKAIEPIVDKHKHRLFLDHSDIGLVYNNIGPSPKHYKKLYKNFDYMKLEEPLIINDRTRHLFKV